MSKEEKVYQGEVLFFSGKRGYGFIAWEEEKDLFVHFSNITGMDGKFKTLKKGQKVEFTLGANHKDKQACNVRVTEEPKE